MFYRAWWNGWLFRQNFEFLEAPFKHLRIPGYVIAFDVAQA